MLLGESEDVNLSIGIGIVIAIVIDAVESR